jgi:hypothetical protein
LTKIVVLNRKKNMMRGSKVTLLPILLLLLLGAFATASTPRLPKKRALKRGDEELLFTEGRKHSGKSKVKGEKGGSGSGSYSSGDLWASPDGTGGGDEMSSAESAGRAKEKETMFDRTSMKTKERSNESIKEAKGRTEDTPETKQGESEDDDTPKKSARKGVKGVVSSTGDEVEEKGAEKGGKAAGKLSCRPLPLILL